MFTSEHLLLVLLSLPACTLEAPAPPGAEPEVPPARGTSTTALTILASVTALLAALGRWRSLPPPPAVAVLAAGISPAPPMPRPAPRKRRPAVVWGRPTLSAAPRSHPRTT